MGAETERGVLLRAMLRRESESFVKTVEESDAEFWGFVERESVSWAILLMTSEIGRAHV